MRRSARARNAALPRSGFVGGQLASLAPEDSPFKPAVGGIPGVSELACKNIFDFLKDSPK
jgi:hypothetical protein